MVYLIRLKDTSTKAKTIINLLKSLEEDYDFIEIVSEKDNPPKSVLYKELEKAFHEVRLIKDGKIKAKSLTELLNEH
ncbi:MAG TPA: hypothetical protein PKL64_08340 [Bacteroidales bacterium]|nr:hypothetical protein [Bacteroidales bacterium]